jgi:hypothetical protein
MEHQFKSHFNPFAGEFEKSFDIEIDDNAIPLFQVIEVGSAPQKIGLN